MHALGEYGVMHVKLYEDIARHGHIATTYAYPARVAGRYIMDPSPIPKFDNPKLDDCPALQLFGAGREKRIYAIPPYTRVVSLDFEDHPFERTKFDAHCEFCGATESFLDEVVTDDAGGRMFVCSDTDYCEKRQARRRRRRSEPDGRRMLSVRLPSARALLTAKRYGAIQACREISFELEEGEALAIVGESGSGKTTLLHLIAGLLAPDAGAVRYRLRDGALRDLAALTESERRALMRTDWGFVHQDSSRGLRMNVSAGGNIGERLMALGDRHYGRIRRCAGQWLERVEIAPDRLDDRPSTYSGGMRQRLQIARNLVTSPRLVFMDEPTGGLDVSVQARLLDLIRGLIADMGLAVVLVTHDLSVARLLSNRILVMKQGEVVESGLTDRVLDDPQAPYTQLLVSSVLAA